MRVLSTLLIGANLLTFVSAACAQEVDWQKVDDAFGRKAAVVAGDVHRYGFARTDLNVTLDGVTIRPALALGGWVAFKPMGRDVMVMGDLVLLETEINPVMAKLLEGDRLSHRLSEFESGRREPNLLVLLRYARLAKVSVESLIDDEMDLSL